MSMNALQHQAFGELLVAWHRREDARATNNFRDLANARFALESARDTMRSTLSTPR